MIMAFMPFPPSATGHGGAQRAWAHLNALSRHGPVDIVLLHAPAVRAVASLEEDGASAIAASVTRIAVPAWNSAAYLTSWMPKRLVNWVDLARMGTTSTPRFDRKTLKAIASQLPARDVDVLFCGRLSNAVIADQLIAAGLLRTKRFIVDFDDVLSNVQRQEIASLRARSVDRKLFGKIALRIIQHAERHIGAVADKVSVCSDDDVAVVARTIRTDRIVKAPNVIDRPLLPAQRKDHFSLLFVGNLAFWPNLQGLHQFIDEAWPIIRASGQDIRLRVVGLNPSPELANRLRNAGIELHANVPSVEPFYAEADAVIAPIFMGSGTRIKILEAMAYGRAVVSTTLGAEGLEVVPGKHARIADTMLGFANAVIALAQEPAHCAELAANGRVLQQERFGPPAMAKAIDAMMGGTPRLAQPQSDVSATA